MTFYEAALRVLEGAGRPLHFQEITEKSIQQSLLSHVGKTPELTMLSRLLAMARRKTDRKVVVTSKDTFALADWALPEEPTALAETAKSESREEDNLPPLRPAERHPEARSENVRIAGRGTERKRRREDEDGKRRKRKFPPMSEVVFEILTDEGGPLKPSAIIERARERELAGESLGEPELLTALIEDNQRRIDAGRRPQFVYDAQSGEVNLERAGAPSEAPPLDLQAAFAAALGIPMEGGRPLLRKSTAVAETPEELVAAQAALKTAAKDARRATARALRKRLVDLDPGTFERAMVKVLHALGFRELKVAKRSKEGPVLTARKREGSLELRYAIRLLKGSTTVDRRTVQELRKDLGHYSAQVALLVGAGELRGEAKAEATERGSLVFLWCGDALAEKFLDAELAVQVTQIQSYELDERFFDQARADAEDAQRRREERMRDKHTRRDEPRSEEPERQEGGAAEPEEQAAPAKKMDSRPPAAEQVRGEKGSDAEGEEDGEDGEEGDEDLEEAEAFIAGAKPEGEAGAEGQPGAASGERRRRRRRRRGRRGRGPRVEGAEGQGGEPAAAASSNGGPGPAAPASGTSGEGPSASPEPSAPAAAAAPAEPRETPPPPPPPPPAPASSGSGEGSA